MGDGPRRYGDLVARGNTSDVWRWSPTTVVKLLRPDVPSRWAHIEADITAALHEAGVPVPGVDGVVEVEGRAGIVFEHIDGVSMWDRMTAAPVEIPGLIDRFVGLQAEVQATPAVAGIPDLTQRIERKVDSVPDAAPEDRMEARRLLQTLPRGTALCHGDMHPANVLMASRGMVIVDWFDAAVGSGCADFVRSSLLVRPPSTSELAKSHLGGASRGFRSKVYRTYLSQIARQSSFDAPRFAEWEALLAFARMAEPVPTGDLAHIWSDWLARTDSAHSQQTSKAIWSGDR